MNVQLTPEQLTEMGQLFGKGFLSTLPLEERLAGLKPEERLAGLPLSEIEELEEQIKKLKQQKKG